MSTSTRHIPYKVLESFARTALLHSGVPERDAATVANCLLHANLAGVDSHGIVHLGHYLRRLANGSIAAQPHIRYSQPRRGLLHVDGGDGLGHMVMARAIDRGLEVCATEGSVAIVVANSSHFGMAAYHVRRITLANVVGMVMTHTDARIVPTGAKKPFFGTNPLALGFPASREPLILDFATSSVPFGKISVAKAEGCGIPLDWGLNKEGEPTADPNQVVGLHPIAGHKGSGLAMMIDLFCSIFSGMAYGPHINRMFEDLESPRKLGHFIALWDVGALMPIDEVKQRVDEYVTELHSLPRRDPAVPVYFPGEPETLKRAERLERGIPIEFGLLQELRDLGQWLQVGLEGLE
jgi:ureidoglycolate dehydrogenase (NAD+)